MQILNTPILILDEPRFAYRGLLVDVSREYFDISFLKTSVLQSIAMAKINVLHLHLSDDDTIPLELPSFPGITEYAAWSSKETYSV